MTIPQIDDSDREDYAWTVSGWVPIEDVCHECDGYAVTYWDIDQPCSHCNMTGIEPDYGEA
jgi:hypothetical protein